MFASVIEIRFRGEKEVPPKVIPIQLKTVCGRRRLEIDGKGEVNDIPLDETDKLLLAFARANE